MTENLKKFCFDLAELIILNRKLSMDNLQKVRTFQGFQAFLSAR
jgi:hypothetical protein